MATWFLLTCPPQFSPFCFFGLLHFPSVPRYPCPIKCSKLQSYCAEFLSLLQTRHVLSAFLFTFAWNPWLTYFHFRLRQTYHFFFIPAPTSSLDYFPLLCAAICPFIHSFIIFSWISHFLTPNCKDLFSCLYVYHPVNFVRAEAMFFPFTFGSLHQRTMPGLL